MPCLETIADKTCFFATQINDMDKQNVYKTNQIYAILYSKLQFALDSL